MGSAEGPIRYGLALPSSLSAALALHAVHRRRRTVGRDGDRIGRLLSLTAVVFALYGLLAGSVVPRATFFPASLLNTDAFFAATGCASSSFAPPAAS